MSRRASIAAIAVVASIATHARAQSPVTPTRAALAEQLFRDGRALIAEHRYKEACEKLDASQKLDPAVGTLLSLGECFTGQGRAASAWLVYRSAVALAAERNDPRSAAAAERAAAIEPQLSRLVLREVRPDPRVTIAIDGEAFGADVLRVPVPIDPGPHVLAARAPGFVPWTTRVQVGALGDTVRVDVPELEPLPDPSVVARERARIATRRTIGWTLGGAGLAVVGVGSILGLQAMVKIRDANRACPGADPCADANAVHENDVGGRLATASTVIVPIGAALIGAGAFLLVTSRRPGAPAIDASVADGGGRVGLRFAW